MLEPVMQSLMLTNSAFNEGRITSISGRLTIDSIDHQIVLLAQESDIQMIIGRDTFSWRKILYAFQFHKGIITGLHAILAAQGIRLIVELAGIEVAALGRGATPSAFSRLLLGVPLSIRLIPLVKAVVSCKFV